MKFYDAHIHFYFTFPAEELKRVFGQLTKIGLIGFNALVFTEFPTELKKYLKMAPAAYHPLISLESLEMQRDPFPYFEWAKPLTVIPFMDCRYIEKGIEEKMERFKRQGFKGLKLFYVPEEDRAFQVKGMEQAFGRPLKKSEEITARLIDSASSQGMSVLLHVDLRRYSNFVEEMIRSHPETNFNIPHFGFSRKALSPLLETYPNCYTDTSGLFSFMEEEPATYRSFIRQYQDRMLYGSDAFIDDPGHIESSLKFVERLLDDQEVFHKVVCKNYTTFHGIS